MDGEMDPVAADVAEELRVRNSDALNMLELLTEYRGRVEFEREQFERPQAVLEYIDFFGDYISKAAAECERVADELANGIRRDHVFTLRQLSRSAAEEESRCVIFRDKWINKPLPYEYLRPLLNDISVATRDQLMAFRELFQPAARLEMVLFPEGQSPEEQKSFDRRALFTRLFRR